MEHKKLDEECVMPDYKEMYEEAAKQAEYWKQECQRQSFETVYLRAVKHTTEAFLGRKIADETADRYEGLYQDAKKSLVADTVRKMQERLKAHLEKPEFPWDSFTVAEEVIDQIAKEMLEGGTK